MHFPSVIPPRVANKIHGATNVAAEKRVAVSKICRTAFPPKKIRSMDSSSPNIRSSSFGSETLN
jgi:hypothetical protein